MGETRWLTKRQQEAWRAFMAMQAQLQGQLARDLAVTGLSDQDYGVLVHLSDANDERSRVTEIAEALGWEKSRLSHHLSRMEQRGLVERSRCPTDQRGWHIHLTAKGHAAIVEAAPVHVASVRRWVVDVLTPAQLDQLKQLSTAVLDALAERG